MRQDMESQVAFTYVWVYMTQDLSMEDSYIIHENDYWHNKPQYSHADKRIVANCSVLSVTSYITGIGMPNSKNTATAEEKPHWADLMSTFYSCHALLTPSVTKCVYVWL